MIVGANIQGGREMQSNCPICGKSVIWLRTATGRTMPFNSETVDEEDAHYIQGKHILHKTICSNIENYQKQSIRKGSSFDVKL